MPIHAPKFWFWGSEPLNVIGHHRDPKRHILGGNRTYMPILVQIGLRGATWARAEGIKKERKKGEERNFFWRRFPID